MVVVVVVWREGVCEDGCDDEEGEEGGEERGEQEDEDEEDAVVVLVVVVLVWFEATGVVLSHILVRWRQSRNWEGMVDSRRHAVGTD